MDISGNKLLTYLLTIYTYEYRVSEHPYEYRVSEHPYEYRVSGQFTSWIYINKINITLHFFTHVETLGVGYITTNLYIFFIRNIYFCPPKDVPRRQTTASICTRATMFFLPNN